jgi:tRNA dimethylallyltransferase
MTEEKAIQDITEFLQTAAKPLLVILGPTASGKTSLSIKLAKKFDGEVISADSRQLYRDMEIGTDAISQEKMDGVPHHMVGVLEPNEQFTVAEYKQKSIHIVNTILRKKKVPILVGGTGLYISAIVENYEIPQVPPNFELRNQLQKEAEKYGTEYIYKKLQEIDPQTAEKIDRHNPRYIMRAIEIKKAGLSKDDTKKKPLFDHFFIGINRPREELYKRIEKRVDEQVQSGLTEEVEKLMQKGYDETLPAITALGVKELMPYLRGEISLEEAKDQIKQNTRNYAKRQMTWFRRYKDIHWITNA